MHRRKNYKVGFETEMLILEDDGSVSVRADELIDATQKLKLPYLIHKDYTHNMLEISSKAQERFRHGMHEWFLTVHKIMEVAHTLGMRLYPFSVYPGTHIPTARTDPYYRMCETVLGARQYKYATGHSHGLHLHYSLPYGTFNTQSRDLKSLFNSSHKETLVNLYNIIIAMDPALTNFTESSPFVDGTYVAKDTRVLMYRDLVLRKGKKRVEGLYYHYPLFGKLPHYIHGISDLILVSKERHQTWKDMVMKNCPIYQKALADKHPLQFNWSPLRINKVGTIEYRGLDMCLPQNILGVGIVFRHMLRHIFENGLEVKPADFGIKEAFKQEGETIYVPPYSYVHNILQHNSALEGFDNVEVYQYTRKFLRCVLKYVPTKKDPCLPHLISMIENRKTASDNILGKIRNDGYDIAEKLPENYARQLAVYYSEKFKEQVEFFLDRELLFDMPI